MFINLSLSEKKGSDEARRSLTNLIEVINRENLRDPNIRLSDKHILQMQDNVSKFNEDVYSVNDLKNSFLQIFNEATGANQ